VSLSNGPIATDFFRLFPPGAQREIKSSERCGL